MYNSCRSAKKHRFLLPLHIFFGRAISSGSLPPNSSSLLSLTAFCSLCHFGKGGWSLRPQRTRKHGRRNLGQVSGVCEEEGNSNHRKREIKIVLEKMLPCNTSFCCSRFWFSFRGNSFPLLCSTLTLPREEKGGGDHKVNVKGNSVSHSRRGGGYRRKVVHLWDWR